MAGLPGSIKLEQLVMEAGYDGDIAPVQALSPSIGQAISDFNATQVAILNGGPIVQTQGWKWNRFFPEPFLTISWQSDYYTNILNIGWLEGCQAIDVNNTTRPKPAIDMYAVKDLTVTNYTSTPKNICWLPNNQLMHGTWGGNPLANEFGLLNPGPGVVYTNPFGANAAPSNPTTMIKDTFGNLWRILPGTQAAPQGGYGTCGNTNPFLTNLNPTYPTYAAPTAAATQVTDGTTIWEAINPYAQGFRIGPIPSNTSRVWGIRPIAQMKPQPYSIALGLEQYTNPIPDELYTYFLDGFKIRLGMRSVDPKTQKKYKDMYPLWIAALDNSIRTGNREPDNFMFVPTHGVMQPSYGYAAPRPDYPYGTPWGF